MLLLLSTVLSAVSLVLTVLQVIPPWAARVLTGGAGVHILCGV